MSIKLKALWGILLLSPTIASAQFYDYYNYYLYIEVGQTIESTSKITYVHFNSDGEACIASITKEKARKLYNDGILDEYAINLSHDKNYDRETSTASFEVYKKERTETRQSYDTTPWYPGKPVDWGYYTAKIGGYWFNAFSTDRKQMIYWYTTKDSNEAKGKKHYKKINPSDLIPQEVDYDFLK